MSDVKQAMQRRVSIQAYYTDNECSGPSLYMYSQVRSNCTPSSCTRDGGVKLKRASETSYSSGYTSNRCVWSTNAFDAIGAADIKLELPYAVTNNYNATRCSGTVIGVLAAVNNLCVSSTDSQETLYMLMRANSSSSSVYYSSSDRVCREPKSSDSFSKAGEDCSERYSDGDYTAQGMRRGSLGNPMYEIGSVGFIVEESGKPWLAAAIAVPIAAVLLAAAVGFFMYRRKRSSISPSLPPADKSAPARQMSGVTIESTRRRSNAEHA